MSIPLHPLRAGVIGTGYRSLYEHIAAGRKTPVLFATAADGHHEVKLCEAILRSSKGRKWVKV